jgi:hypothetical protein
MLRSCVLLATVLASAGCVRSATARGTGWWRVTTDHVRLTTDVDHDRAVTAGWAFEDLARALSSVFPVCGGESMGDPLEVTMLAHPSEYTEITDVDRSGVYQPARSGLIAQPARLVVPATVRGPSSFDTARPSDTQLFLRELTRRFAQACFQAVPVWLDQGLASFFETLRVVENDIVIGIAPFRIGTWGPRFIARAFLSDGISIRQASRAMLVPPSRLSHDDGAAFRTDHPTPVYASAWMFVHMLELGPDAALRRRFVEALEAMHAGEASWLYGSDDGLDAAFESYAASPHFVEQRIAYDPPPLADPIAVSMSPGEAGLVLAALELRRATMDHGRFDAYLALARQDPDTAARAELMRLQRGELHEGETQRSVVEALVASHPDDRAALVARARRVLAGDNAGVRASVALAALRDRTDLDAQDLVIEAMLARGLESWELALTAAAEAVRRDPGNEAATRALRDAAARRPCPLEQQPELLVAPRVVSTRPLVCGLTRAQREERRPPLR